MEVHQQNVEHVIMFTVRSKSKPNQMRNASRNLDITTCVLEKDGGWISRPAPHLRKGSQMVHIVQYVMWRLSI